VPPIVSSTSDTRRRTPASEIAAWALFVSVHVPGFSGTPEGIETIALVSKAAKLAGVALAFPLALPRLRLAASVTSPS
jgi:hypothetical protein